MKLLVIIPAYNEEDSIVSTIEELEREAQGIDYVIVNDGSKDNTKALCASTDTPCSTFPEHRINRGLSPA